MKKLLALLLTVAMVFTICVPAFAAYYKPYYVSGEGLNTKYPMIILAGDSNPVTYDNETKSFRITDMLNLYKDTEDGSFAEAAKNILYPFILKGIVSDDWDDYYEAVYKEISDVYAPIMLDENGNVTNDSGIPEWQKQDMQNAMATSRALSNGKFAEESYQFFYDWRLDPIEVADQLHEYIEGVKQSTGSDKVTLCGRCLGTEVVLAYLSKYSSDGLSGVGLDVSTANGAGFLSGMVSGDFGIDGSGISRLATDIVKLDYDYADYVQLVDFIAATIDLLENTGVIDKLTDTARDLLYSKIEYGIISALALSTFMTFPGYWAVVSADKFDTALNYVFGEEGSEKRIKYAGLIDKITYYNETVKKNTYSIVGSLKDAGVNVCIIAKYGIQMVPLLKESDILGDEYCSAHDASFGATTGTIYKPLSDEYIAQRVEAGYGKYISPDKNIDASTCLCPDNTWFIKGAQHAMYPKAGVGIMVKVLDADHQLTVDDFDYTQFLVYDFNTRKCYPMTAENSNTELWDADDKIDNPKTENDKISSFLVTLIKWFTSLFNWLTSRFK